MIVPPNPKRVRLSPPSACPDPKPAADDVIIILDSDDEDVSPRLPSSTPGRNIGPSPVASGDSDVEIVPVQPVPSLSAGAASNLATPLGGDDDLQTVGVVTAAVVYPHLRADCQSNKFEYMNTDAAHAVNVKKCDKCYCYVCDSEASKCTSWSSHCMASDKRTAWRNLRTRKRARPSEAVIVPTLLMPPMLRVAAGANPTASANQWPRLARKTISRAFLSAVALPDASVAATSPSPYVQSRQALTAQRRQDFVKKLQEKERKVREEKASHVAGAIPKSGTVYNLKRTKKPWPTGPTPSSAKSYLVGKIDFWMPYCSHQSVTYPEGATVTSHLANLGLFEESGKNPYLLHVLLAEAGVASLGRDGDLYACNGNAVYSTFSQAMYSVGSSSNPCFGDDSDDEEAFYSDPFPGGTANPTSAAHKNCLREKVLGVQRDVYGAASGATGYRYPHGKEVAPFLCDSNKSQFSSYICGILDECILNNLVAVRWEHVHHDGSEGSNPDGALALYHHCLAPGVIGEDAFLENVKKTENWRKKCQDRLAKCNVLDNSNCCRLRAHISLLPAAFGSSNVFAAAKVADDKKSPEAFTEPIDLGNSDALLDKTQVAKGVKSARAQDMRTTTILGRLLMFVDFADFPKLSPSLEPSVFFPKDLDSPLMRPVFRGIGTQDHELIVRYMKLYASDNALISDGDVSLQQQLFSLEGILSSPLFTVSTGYSGGPASQPTDMAVSLRPYQLETLKWMEDQEARRSVSEPFWVKRTLAPCFQNKLVPGTPSKDFWYCPLTGHVSRYPPPKIVGGILAEEMGLGKTILAISMISNSLAAARAQPVFGSGTPGSPLRAKTTLVVTPVSLLEQWRLEFERRANPGSMSVCVWYGPKRPRLPVDVAKHDVVITTYSTMASTQSASTLASISWYRIIIDESTYVKGGSTRAVYNTLMNLGAPRRWAVSGTPFANNIKSILPIMQFIGVSPFANSKVFSPILEDFNARLRDGVNGGARAPGILPSLPTAALAFILKSTVMRHLKRQKLHGQNLVELPPSSGQMVEVKLTAPELDNYAQAEKEARDQARHILASEGRVNSNIINLRAYLHPVRLATSGIVRTCTGITLPSGIEKRVYSTKPTPNAAKMTQLVADIKRIRTEDPLAKFVIFSENDPLKCAVKATMAAANIGSCAIDGSMPATKRGIILQCFKDNPEQIVLVLSAKFAHGLTLTMANVVVLLEPSLSQETELQAVDRVRRIGQTRPTKILTYVAMGTVDERVTKMRIMKGQAAAIGMPAPKDGNEIISHATSYRMLFGVEATPDYDY